MMNLMPYRNNRRNELSAFGDFPSMFTDQFMRRFFGDDLMGMMGGSMRTDIRETEGSYIIEAEMPGVKREDISVDVSGDTLTISVNRGHEENTEKENYVYRERRYGSMQRSFDLTGIDEQAIAGRFENGVLTLELPKSAEKSSARKIEIE